MIFIKNSFMLKFFYNAISFLKNFDFDFNFNFGLKLKIEVGKLFLNMGFLAQTKLAGLAI